MVYLLFLAERNAKLCPLDVKKSGNYCKNVKHVYDTALICRYNMKGFSTFQASQGLQFPVFEIFLKSLPDAP